MLKSRLIVAANCRRFFHIIESDSTDMNDHRPGVKTLFQLFLILLLTTGNKLLAQDGATIFAHINKVASAPKAPTPGSQGEGVKADDSDSSILYGVLTLILAVVALIMLQVNANLRKLADDKEGVPAHEPIPFYRNKSYITLLTLLLFIVGGFFVVKGAIGLGRTQNY